MRRIAVLAGALLSCAVLLAGCVALEVGRNQLVPGADVRILGNGALVIGQNCPLRYDPTTGTSQPLPCWVTKVVAASDPGAVEVWQFEARLVVGDGSFGRQPHDYLVAGYDRCDYLRLRTKARGIPTAAACERAGLHVLVPAEVVASQ